MHYVAKEATITVAASFPAFAKPRVSPTRTFRGPFTPWSLCLVSSCSSGPQRSTRARCSYVGSAGLQLACYNMSFVVPVKETQRMEYQLPPPPVTAPNLSAHQVPVGVMQGTLTHVQAQDESHRWTQYQQLWRQHVYMNGMITVSSENRKILTKPTNLNRFPK